jgi:hypothetical protein
VAWTGTLALRTECEDFKAVIRGYNSH